MPDMMEPSWPLNPGKKTKLVHTLVGLVHLIWGCILVFQNMNYLSSDGRELIFSKTDPNYTPPDECTSGFFNIIFITTMINLCMTPMKLFEFITLLPGCSKAEREAKEKAKQEKLLANESTAVNALWQKRARARREKRARPIARAAPRDEKEHRSTGA